MTITLYWLLAMVVLIIIECISLGLTTIWFAGGTLVAAVASALGAPLVVQVVLCIAVSVLLLCFTRPWAMKYLNKGIVKTNAESMIGQTAVVTIPVDNIKSEGQIQFKGSYWTARSREDELKLEQGSRVIIREITGVTCVVEPVEP
jgi:membrane protein implicated in regulation of membrane protease activity